MEQLLSIEEVAERFKLTVATMRYWRHIGHGPKSFKVGRRVRYRICDVEEWLAQQYDETA